MATFSADWIENQSVTFDDDTPAKTVEGKGPIDLAADGYIAVDVQVSIAFGASADGNATIRIRRSADSGTTKDTILAHSQQVAYTVSTTKRVSILVEGVAWIEIGVYNGNTAVEDITISAIYAGKKYASA